MHRAFRGVAISVAKAWGESQVASQLNYSRSVMNFHVAEKKIPEPIFVLNRSDLEEDDQLVRKNEKGKKLKPATFYVLFSVFGKLYFL